MDDRQGNHTRTAPGHQVQCVASHFSPFAALSLARGNGQFTPLGGRGRAQNFSPFLQVATLARGPVVF